MAKFNMELPSIEDTLFSTQAQRDQASGERITKIPLNQIHNFKDHPFSVELDNDMRTLIDSVKENGVLVPVLVRPDKDGNGYEMIAGHRRKFALENLGFTEMNAIVRDLDDDTATILMVDSNIQREHIKPVERGYAYKMRLDAMKHQGKSTVDYTEDVGIEYNSSTSRQVGEKLVSVDMMASELGIAPRQVHRFIRLTYLIPSIQKMVNEESETGLKMAFNPAVELSYLSIEHQEVLFKLMSKEQVTPSLAQCQELKRRSKSGELDTDFIYDVIKTEKPNQRERISIDTKQINRYFPKNFTMKQKQDLIIKLLREWDQKQKNVQSR